MSLSKDRYLFNHLLYQLNGDCWKFGQAKVSVSVVIATRHP